MKKSTGKKFFRSSMTYVVLTGLAFICLIPFFWMISTSLKKKTEMWTFPPQWIPEVPQWSNYIDALTAIPFMTYFLNTMTLELFMVLGQLISCTLVAYGFARFRFRGREALFLIMLATMLIPEQVTMIPTFLLFSRLDWIDTYLPLIVPSFFGNAFYIFLMRQYMLSIPKELDEAAKIDGANALQILWSVLLPLLRPPMAIIVVFTFTAVYNDFMGPLIYLNSPENFTLAIGMANFVSSKGGEWHQLMAASTVVLLPLLLIYYVAQKHLVGGMANMGIKG